MAQTKQSIFINLINRVYGQDAWKKQEKLMKGLKKRTTLLRRSFQEVEGSMKKVTTVTAGLNEKGKPWVKTNEKLIDISDQLAKKQNQEAKRREKLAARQEKQQQKARALVSQQKKVAEWSNRLGLSENEMAKALSKAGYKWDEQGKLIGATGKRVKDIDKALNDAKETTKRFKMEYLGLLFAGMAIKRLFSTIQRAAVTSFQKIMESNDMLGTAVQRLGVHWEYLKFTVGSAINRTLEPLMPMIMNIISVVSEWIQQHPILTGWIIFLGIALGTLLLIVGQVFLGLNSFLGVLGNLGISTNVAGKSVIGLIGKFLSWLVIIAFLGGVLKGFFDAFMNDISNTKSHTEQEMSSMEAFIKNFVTVFWVMAQITGRLIYSFVMTTVKGFWGIVEATGDGIRWLMNQLSNFVATKLNDWIGKIVKAWNYIRSLFGKEPIEVDFKFKTDGWWGVGDFGAGTFKDIGSMWKDEMGDISKIIEGANEKLIDLFELEKTGKVKNMYGEKFGKGADLIDGKLGTDSVDEILTELNENLDQAGLTPSQEKEWKNNINIQNTYNFGDKQYSQAELKRIYEDLSKREADLIQRSI